MWREIIKKYTRARAVDEKMIMDKKGKDASSWLHLHRIILIVIIINIIKNDLS